MAQADACASWGLNQTLSDNPHYNDDPYLLACATCPGDPRKPAKPRAGIDKDELGDGVRNDGAARMSDILIGLGHMVSGIGAGAGALGGNYGLTANQTFRYAQGSQSAKAISAAHTAHSLRVANALGRISLVGGILGTGVSINNVLSDYQAGGWNQVSGWDVSDSLVGVGGLAASGAVAFGLMSNPVGWGIAIGVGVYFGARLIYDLSTEP